jgi:hypothetical protein
MKKEHKNPKGGLTEAGRKFFKRTEGSNLKAPVKTGTNPRRVSFAARFGGCLGRWSMRRVGPLGLSWH